MNEDVRAISHDIRIRGFGRLTPVRDAVAAIDLHTQRLMAEPLQLITASGRVLAESVVAPVNVPNFARSAMDGFAVKLDESTNTRRIVGDSRPGRPFSGSLQTGQAVRIMTGSPVPEGAEAVIAVENCLVEVDSLEMREQPPSGKNIAMPGEDVVRGREVLSSGRVLRPQDLGLLASLGLGSVNVLRKPRVKIVTSGSELLPPGAPPSEHRIPDSNSVMLRALAERDGGTLVESKQVADDPTLIEREMESADWDLLLMNGGTSVGVEDHAPRALQRHATTMIHGIDMKPGMPAGFGWMPDRRAVFLLPGNPAACLVGYDLLARRCLRRLAGRSADFPYPTLLVTLADSIISKPGRVDYVRLRISLDTRLASPLPLSGAANLSGTVSAEGFVIVDQETSFHEAGSTIEARLYDLRT